MLHYICYVQSLLTVDDKTLHPLQKDTYTAITSFLGKLNTELWATLLNDNRQEMIQVRDSYSNSELPPKLPEKVATTKDETPKLSEMVATTPFHQLPAPSLNIALLGSPSVVPPTAALVSIPVTQQLHEPSSTKNSKPDTPPHPMVVQQDAALTSALLTDSSPLTSITSKDLYLKAIQEMYPQTNIDWLRKIWPSMKIGV